MRMEVWSSLGLQASTHAPCRSNTHVVTRVKQNEAHHTKNSSKRQRPYISNALCVVFIRGAASPREEILIHLRPVIPMESVLSSPVHSINVVLLFKPNPSPPLVQLDTLVFVVCFPFDNSKKLAAASTAIPASRIAERSTITAIFLFWWLGPLSLMRLSTTHKNQG